MIAVFYTTINDYSNAEKLAESLVKAKLVACANVFPGVKSIYEWDGELCKDEECVIILKSEKSKFKQIEVHFKKHHPYDTPCLLELNVSNTSESYESWLLNQIK